MPGPYQSAWQRFREWARSTNGVYDGEAQVPKVKREQGAAILRYAMKIASEKLSGFDASAWYPIALSLLGWSKPGDRFKLDSAWRTGFGDAVTVGALWQFTLDVAIEADNRKVVFTSPRPLPTTDYGVVATKAWEKMKADDPKAPVPVRPFPVATSDEDELDAEGKPKKPKPKPKKPGVGLGGAGMMLLLLYLLHKS